LSNERNDSELHNYSHSYADVKINKHQAATTLQILIEVTVSVIQGSEKA